MSDIYYKSITKVTNILLFLENVKAPAYNEMVEIKLDNGDIVSGQVLDASDRFTVIQSFGSTSGMNIGSTSVRLTGETAKFSVSDKMLGRMFNGLGEPIDGGPAVYGGEERDINGAPINPYAREEPSEFIQTGISSIDGMNSLVRGQKLPIFSGSGMKHNQLAMQIVKQAKVLNDNERFAVVFGGIGITSESANFFKDELESSGALDRTVVFLNLSSSPSVERIMLPRVALTAAEYLAYDKGMEVLVVLVDMTNYCEALKEISAAREEIPSRRGYPGYMYTDLASIFERAGKIKEKKGSITLLPILTMPGDDITHPIPDLTGYITEGQVVMNRDLEKKGIVPNIDVLSSLSRLMNQGIGANKTREDHRNLANQLFAAYAAGKDLRSLSEVVGEGALSSSDKKLVEFSDKFEREFVNQGYEQNRSITDTLSIGWELLSYLDKSEMKRLKSEEMEKYGKWTQ
ncbi:MAG: V-type ATP synthase subunit B [Candidatus Parvarchaeota archaeon]|nr:V-type ATP synthase subunit B [Candidatus Parvarchaeota archaeon]